MLVEHPTPVGRRIRRGHPEGFQLLIQPAQAEGHPGHVEAGHQLATLTVRQHHPGAPVLLITDPWQLPRATAAFRHQDLQVIPLAAAPVLGPTERNRLALRETAATVLYRLQGRL